MTHMPPLADPADSQAPQASLPSGLIALAAGGTGGHLFPAQALAGELLSKGQTPLLITDGRGAAYQGWPAGCEIEQVPSSALRGGIMAKVRGLGALWAGYCAARRLLRAKRPKVIVGFGGYPSAPTVLAAAHLDIPVILHEQNAVLGRANRWLARYATVLATSAERVELVPKRCTARQVLTGNPVRAELIARRGPATAIEPGTPIELLVLGGSQGARVFADVMPPAIARLPRSILSRLSISQQCRPEDLDRVRTAYASYGVEVELAGFFSDVPARLQRAQLVISRAGASTVAELKTVGRPALLVPYPHAADDHQSANAEAFCEAGGAWLMPQAGFTPEAVCYRLEALISLPDRLKFAAQCAHEQGIPDAAERLAAVTLEVAHLRGPQAPSLGRTGATTANSAPQTAPGTARAAMETAA